ncbi:hypothetical protein PR048_028360 [Dryococelus australis]|uniref:Uncharacterized protein n=1 Tax=Dryococelus australis TaxID=614101 RepID=A0ABQ9GJ30_9NEOP|nr:hypothetical protein PR048_028360 [Dryococelus australis]
MQYHRIDVEPSRRVAIKEANMFAVKAKKGATNKKAQQIVPVSPLEVANDILEARATHMAGTIKVVTRCSIIVLTLNQAEGVHYDKLPQAGRGIGPCKQKTYVKLVDTGSPSNATEREIWRVLKRKEIRQHNVVLGESDDAPSIPAEPVSKITPSSPEDPLSPFYDPSDEDLKPLANLYLTRQRLYEKKNCVEPLPQHSDDGECLPVTPHTGLTHCSPTLAGCCSSLSLLSSLPNTDECHSSPSSCTWVRGDLRLACSRHTKVNRVLSPAVSLPDFRMWESCLTMPLRWSVGFLGDFPFTPHFRTCSALTHLNHPHRLSKPRYCSVSHWSQWTSCSVTCGKGERLRQRFYVDHEKADSLRCRTPLTSRSVCFGSLLTCRYPPTPHIYLVPSISSHHTECLLHVIAHLQVNSTSPSGSSPAHSVTSRSVFYGSLLICKYLHPPIYQPSHNVLSSAHPVTHWSVCHGLLLPCRYLAPPNLARPQLILSPPNVSGKAFSSPAGTQHHPILSSYIPECLLQLFANLQVPSTSPCGSYPAYPITTTRVCYCSLFTCRYPPPPHVAPPQLILSPSGVSDIAISSPVGTNHHFKWLALCISSHHPECQLQLSAHLQLPTTSSARTQHILSPRVSTMVLCSSASTHHLPCESYLVYPLTYQNVLQISTHLQVPKT